MRGSCKGQEKLRCDLGAGRERQGSGHGPAANASLTPPLMVQ